MNTHSVDHYTVLGVLPDAEQVVITAAYRALAQRYHPDKVGKSDRVTLDRMSAINEAYRVLGNPETRAEYDSKRNTNEHATFDAEPGESTDEAFSPVIAELEDRWSIANELFPHLQSLRENVARISKSLEFAFVIFVLEERSFDRAIEIADHLIDSYVERYFGNDPRIIEYAKVLLISGNRRAALRLNRLIDVLGDSIEGEKIIGRLELQFPELAQKRNLLGEASRRKERLERLLRAVHFDSSFDAAKELAGEFGYTVERQSGSLFGPSTITVRDKHDAVTTFKGDSVFIKWVNTAIRAHVSAA